MDNLKINKKTIFICLILLSLVGLICYLVSNKGRFTNYEKVYEKRIEKYDANQFIPIYVTESDMANKYLNDFKNLMLYDIKEAYNVVNKVYKEKKYTNFERFKENIQDEYSLAFYKMTVKEYDVVNKNGFKFYYIRDSRDKLYIFKELSIMNYEVYLDDYTVEIK